jgi:hypothetical protein
MIGSWPKKDGQKQLHNFNSGEGGGPLPSKPRGARRAGTYNCSEILSYTGGSLPHPTMNQMAMREGLDPTMLKAKAGCAEPLRLVVR